MQRSEKHTPAQKVEPLNGNPIENFAIGLAHKIGTKTRIGVGTVTTLGAVTGVAYVVEQNINPAIQYIQNEFHIGSAEAAFTPDTATGMDIFGYNAPFDATTFPQLVNQLNEAIPTKQGTDANFHSLNTKNAYITLTKAQYDNFFNANGMTLESYLTGQVAPEVRRILKSASPSIVDPNMVVATSTEGFTFAGIVIVDPNLTVAEWNDANARIASLAQDSILVVPGIGFNIFPATSNGGTPTPYPQEYKAILSEDVQQVLKAVLNLPDPSGQNLTSSQIDSGLSARMNPALRTELMKDSIWYSGDKVADVSKTGIGTYNAKLLEQRKNSGRTQNENNVFQSDILPIDAPTSGVSFIVKDTDNDSVLTIDPAQLRFKRRTTSTAPGATLPDTNLAVNTTVVNGKTFFKVIGDNDGLFRTVTDGSVDGLRKGILQEEGKILVEILPHAGMPTGGHFYLDVQDVNMEMWLLGSPGVTPDYVNITVYAAKPTGALNAGFRNRTYTQEQGVVAPTATALETPTPQATRTATVTLTVTETGTITQTRTVTPTATITETLTVTPTSTTTETTTETPTQTLTVSVTVTPTETVTTTATKTPTASQTVTITATATETVTTTATSTHSPTGTLTVSSTSTATATGTKTSSPTYTWTPTPTPTSSTTPIPTGTPLPATATITPLPTFTSSETPAPATGTAQAVATENAINTAVAATVEAIINPAKPYHYNLPIAQKDPGSYRIGWPFTDLARSIGIAIPEGQSLTDAGYNELLRGKKEAEKLNAKTKAIIREKVRIVYEAVEKANPNLTNKKN